MRRAQSHVARTLAAMSRFGFTLATEAEIRGGRAAAAALVGDDIASADVMLRVQARTACASFVLTGPAGMTAALSAIRLTAAALPGLARGVFDALSPPEALVARPRDPVAALYIWGGAGLTWRGRFQAVAAAIALREEVHPTLPLYARAATSEGERVLQSRLGARPGPGDLVVAPPASLLSKVA